MKITVAAPDGNLGHIEGTLKASDSESKIEVLHMMPKGSIIE